jgi:dihydrofolate reductase
MIGAARVSLLAAIAANGAIGYQGKVPWRIPEDLARFRGITMGHTVVMGRKTWESIGKPLDGRTNIVLSRDPDFGVPGCTVSHSLYEAAETARFSKELFVIGGASVYEAFLPFADLLRITRIDAEYPADAYFPGVHWEEWRILEESTSRDAGPSAPAYRFVDYARRIP